MTKNDVLNVIVGHIKEVVPELQDREIHPEDSLVDLGSNSMERAEIVMLAMESLSVRMPISKTLGPKNIGELAELFHAQ